MFPGSTEAQMPVENLGYSGNPKAKPTSLHSLGLFPNTERSFDIGYPTRHQLEEVSESQKSKTAIAHGVKSTLSGKGPLFASTKILHWSHNHLRIFFLPHSHKSVAAR